MRIIALADMHGNTRHLKTIAHDLHTADVVLLVGDLATFRYDAAVEVIEAVRAYNDRLLAVPGNCDEPRLSAFLSDEGINLDGGMAIIDDVAFAGLGGSLPCPIKTPNEYTEAELEATLKRAIADLPLDMVHVLVSHQPPFDTVTDLANTREHVGSKAVRSTIVRLQPLACFTGHIHEGRGMDNIGHTKIVNPGPFWEGTYAYAEIDGQLETLEIRG
ncbi:MAG: metallophosphoesterase family protein [Chloroflexota bacterium]|nr:metallophosphoesterase family protein [Chloroflexota bacterium]